MRGFFTRTQSTVNEQCSAKEDEQWSFLGVIWRERIGDVYLLLSIVPPSLVLIVTRQCESLSWNSSLV